MDIQAARAEIADVVDDVPASVYDYIDGAVNLPAVVVGMPARIDPNHTPGLWLVRLPVYVVTRSADPKAEDTELLDLVTAVTLAVRTSPAGTNYRGRARVDEISDFFDVKVGNIEAAAATVHLEFYVTAPTT